MGDIELDGYPDMVITVEDATGSPKTVFFGNQDCDSTFISQLNQTSGQYKDTSRCRKFARVSTTSLIENAVVNSLSFFDYHEMG